MLKQLDKFQDAMVQDKKEDKSNVKNTDTPKKSNAETGMFIFDSLKYILLYKFDITENLQKWILIRAENIIPV